MKMSKFFLTVLLIAGTVQAFSAEKPLLKVAILSDMQHYDQSADWGYGNTVKAFDMLKKLVPDVLVIAGDLVENGSHDNAFSSYRKLLRDTFGDRQVHLVIAAGNHDVYSIPTQDLQQRLDIFCKTLQIARDNPLRQTLHGYDFITIHDNRTPEFTDEVLSKLKTQLDAAVKRDSKKPIFVVSHYPMPDTVAGSFGAYRMKKLRKLLNNYPQVVHFGAHTHYPLEDERCIWQKEFTALNTSTLSYGCLEGIKVVNTCNGILPFAREVVQFMLLEIYPDKLVFRRFNAEEKREIKPNRRWVVDIPYQPSQARYTSVRAKESKAPEFPADAKLFLRYDYGFAYVIFDMAKHDDLVFAYRVKVLHKTSSGNWQEHFSADYVASFYRLERTRGKREFFKLPETALKNGVCNRIEVYAQETFGKLSNPLVIEYNVPHYWKFAKVDFRSAPQE